MLVLRGVSSGYFGKNVIHDIDLDVHAGEVVALLGPNGSGKTTLLKTVCGAVELDRGSVEVEGTSLVDLSVRDRALKMGYVPQTEDHVFDYTVRELTLMGRLAHSDRLFETPQDHAAADRAMAATDCDVFAGRLMSNLSGGEAQRALIARALAQEAPILLCDEPTTHLDPGHQVEIGTLLRKLSGDGMAVIVTTHDLNWALQFSDRSVLIREGTVRYVGPLAAAIDKGIHAEVYDARFLTMASAGQRFVTPVPIDP